MPALSAKSFTLLNGNGTLVDMKTAASTVLYTVPLGKTLRISHIVVRQPTASLVGGTSYSVTGFAQTFSLATLTSSTGYVIIGAVIQSGATAPIQYTERGAGLTVSLTVTTGSTAIANATVDLFGYLL